MIIVMVLAISKLKLHPFLAIMGAALLLAFAALPLGAIPGSFGSGFAGTFSSLGLVIILGAMIGILLEKTGAALSMADAVVKFAGKKHPDLAMLLMGWIVSIPVFCDSGFVILNPIRKALAKRTGCPPVTMAIALSAGLYTAHVFIPPTPGPVAAAGYLGLENNMLLVIGTGVLISIPVLLAGWLFASRIGKKVTAEDIDTEISYQDLIQNAGKLPPVWISLVPIALPVILMALKSVASLLKISGLPGELINFAGTPMMALACGLIIAIMIFSASGKREDFYKLSDETLRVVGPILFVTAGGGVLGKIISDAGIVSYIIHHIPGLTGISIIFPFLIAALLKTSQGSSTVAITTTAGIMGLYNAENSLMVALNLTTPVSAALTVMAIGAGAMTVSHANDSYFWVVTNFSGIKVQDGYRTQTLCTLVMGITAILFIWLINFLIQ